MVHRGKVTNKQTIQKVLCQEEKNSSPDIEGIEVIQEQVTSQLIYEGCIRISLYNPRDNPRWDVKPV